MNESLPHCPICQEPMIIRLAQGRKSGKPFVMIMCSIDGRHFRGFISHRSYVQQVIESMESIHNTEKQN